MAIDPSISLNIRPVEPVDITKLQQIRNLAAQEEATRQSIISSQAQEALLREQLRGTVPLQQKLLSEQARGAAAAAGISEQQLAIEKRRVELQELLQKLTPDFYREVVDPATNKPVVDPQSGVPQRVLDRQGLIFELNRRGFPAESDALMKSYLETKQQEETAKLTQLQQNLVEKQGTLTEQQTAASRQAQSVIRNDLRNATVAQLANTASKLPENQRVPYLRRAVAALNESPELQGLGDEALSVLGIEKTTPDPRVRVPGVNNLLLKGITEGTITPQQAVTNSIALMNAATSSRSVAVSEEQIKQAGIVNMAGPEARDPNSRISQTARAVAEFHGIPTTPQTSAAELNNRMIQDVIRNDTITAESKEAALRRAETYRLTNQSYQSVNAILEKLIKSGDLTGTTNVQTFIQSQIGKIRNQEDFRALQAKIAEIQKENPAVDINIGASNLRAQIDSFIKTNEGKITESERIAKYDRYSQVPPAGAARQPLRLPGTPGSPTEPTVPLVNRQGRVFNVPERMANQYINSPEGRAQGLKRVQNAPPTQAPTVRGVGAE